jgi:hypothetical protein
MSRLMRFASVTEQHTSAPLMAEVFNLHFDNEVDAVRAQAKLRSLRLNGEPAMLVQRDGTQLTTKCQVHEHVDRGAQLSRGEGTAAVPFFDLFYQLEDSKSGMHHPDGMLWVKTPGRGHRKHEGRVPLASVAPALLRLMEMPVPSHMNAASPAAAASIAV